MPNCSFEACLHSILKEILISPKDRESYLRDADAIRDRLLNEMKKFGFDDAFKGFSLAGSYLDRLKIGFPDEFDYDIKLDFAFNITPLENKKHPGYILLHTDTKQYGGFVEEFLINRPKLQSWLRIFFLKAIPEKQCWLVNGRLYNIEYPADQRGYAVAHTIVASGVRNRVISFDFVPAFEFPASQWPYKQQSVFVRKNEPWFAIPNGGRERNQHPNSFIVSAPHWEHSELFNHNNLKNVLRLMKALRDANNLNAISSYMLKTIFLHEVQKRKEDFWDQSMGLILIPMMEALLQAFRDEFLAFYLNKDVNNLERIPDHLIDKYESKIETLLKKLKDFQEQGTVNLFQVKELFIKA